MSELPEAVRDWVAQVGGGEIVRLEQAVARREAWLVDVARADGSVLEGFLRLERSRHPDDPSSLAKETAVVRALGATDIPVPRLYAWNEALGAALFERVRGRADLPNVPERQQRAVMSDFIDVVARLHSLDLDGLDFPGLRRPTTPAECALSEVDQLLKRHAASLARGVDPLLRYGIAWLRRFAPEQVARVSLVQGDTGPVNFMFEGDRVSAVIDWEWAHLGDPLEDLGNIATREFWNPSGGMDGLIERYRAATGFAVDHFRVRYYCVQQQIRGMMGIHAATENPDVHEPLAWYLAYRYVGDRATCEALADAMAVPLTRPDLPADRGAPNPLADAAVYALEHDIAPAATGQLASSRIADVTILIRCMERVAQHGLWVDDAETRDAGTLLGREFASLANAMKALGAAIDADAVDDAPLIAFLHARAARREWLYDPCTRLYPDRRWSPL